MKTPQIIIFSVISILLVFASLYFPKTINDYNSLNNITCGYPFSFATFMSHKALPDYAWTNSCIGWLGSPRDWGGVRFLWLPLVVNVAIVFCLVVGIFYGKQFIFESRVRAKNKKKKQKVR